MSTRREFFGALVGLRGGPAAPSAPDLSGVQIASVPEETDREALDDAVGRLVESLPAGTSGDADLDFALVAAPLCDALSELAAARAGRSGDPEMAALAALLADGALADVQRLIDWMGSKGHSVG